MWVRGSHQHCFVGDKQIQMAHKTHLAASVVILFLATVVLVESTSNSGKLKLRHLGHLLPAAQQPSLLSASSGAPLSDEPNIIYEDGIVIETVLDENRLGISIYSTLAVPSKDFLYAVDSTASQLLKIRLPIDQSSGADVARRIAGDGKGRTGYNDGWGEDALLDHPKGLAIDGDGNVYVADVRNHVIRKISPRGYVTTLAGQPNKTGHADGEGRNALFSSDFTLTYLPRSCSLLISDRGNGRLRIIQLKNPPLKCDQEGISSGRVWKNVTYLFGVLLTILSAALGIVLYQKAELQQSLALDDESESPFNRRHNGGESKFPYLITRPRLSESAATLRRARSLPDDVSDISDLIDFSDSPGYEGEHNQPRNRLENSAFDRTGDAENDDLISMSSPSNEGDGISAPDNQRIRSEMQELLSDPESTLIGLDDSFSRHLRNNSALVAPDRTISLQEAINRLYDCL